MSQRYGGQLVYLGRDEYSVIEVVESGRERHLHFGTESRQSSMLLHHPVSLALSYTRAMLAGLLLCDEPQRVLLLGLGGGSLVRFLHHHFPELQIDVVELRPAVVEIAHQWFGLPQDERITIHIDDASAFMRGRSVELHGNYDLILVDVFDAVGIAPGVGSGHFFAMCRERLCRTGVVSINLWCEDELSVDDYLDELQHQLGGNRLRLPVEGRANLIGLVTRETRTRRELARMGERAAALDARIDLGLGGLARQLRKFNSGVLR